MLSRTRCVLRCAQRAVCLFLLVGVGACGQRDDVGFGLALELSFGATVSDAVLAQVTHLQVSAKGDESAEFPVVLSRAALRTEGLVYRPGPQTRRLVIDVRASDATGALLALGASGTLTLDAGVTRVERVTLELPTGPPTCIVTEGALLAWRIDVPLAASWLTEADVPYSVDNRAALAGTHFSRIGYCLELDDTWIYTEMDDFTGARVLESGIPADFSWDLFVNNITIRSNSPAVTPVVGATGGKLEMWSSCYDPGLNGVRDYDDDPGAPDCYGSFQVHHDTTTILALNRWAAGTTEMGIGNQVGGSGNPDWTFSKNAASYATRTLRGFIIP